MLLILIFAEEVIQNPIVREVVLGGLGSLIVGYLIRENTKLKDRVKEVIDNHVNDLNKIRDEKNESLNIINSYQEKQNKFIRELIEALNNTKKNQG